MEDADLIARVVAAGLLGAVLGAEREVNGQAAGIRTHALVALGAALFTVAGAYGFAMSSNYNSRPRAAEVLVDGDAAALARARETYPDLVRGEAARPRPRRFTARRR